MSYSTHVPSPGAAPLASFGLSDMLAPMTPQEFLSDYWGKAPLHLPGWVEKFQSIFDRNKLRQLLLVARERGPLSSAGIHAMMPTPDDSLIDTPMTLERIQSDEIDALMAQGITICINDISALDRELAALAHRVKQQMSFTGTARFNCYYSPPGSGADMHFDARASTTLQIEGDKRWLIAPEVSIPWPRANAQCGFDGYPVWAHPGAGHADWEALAHISSLGFREVVLHPGDLLYLPAGTWHDVKATESGSLALNLSFGSTNFVSVLSSLLDQRFIRESEWRAGPPPAFSGVGTQESGMPSEVLTYFATCLAQAADFLRSCDPASTEVTQLWRRLIER